VVEQVKNLAKTNVVQETWDKDQPLTIHGWVYRLDNGLVNDMNVSVSSREGLEQVYHVYHQKLPKAVRS
jgi:carbonic anhydrase